MKSVTIQAVRVIGPLSLEIDWSTGETLPVSLAGLTQPPFDAWLDAAFFAQVRIEEWCGHGLDWPGGLDMDAGRLYEIAREQAGLPTAREFNAWMERNGLTLTSAAQALGMTRRMMAHYRTGSRSIPRVVGLACLGWERKQ